MIPYWLPAALSSAGPVRNLAMGHEKVSLYHGHYFNHDYAAAKQEFCTRSGLMDPDRVFSNEQLAEVYRCVRETLENAYPISQERQRLLETVEEQIRDTIPDLAGRLTSRRRGPWKWKDTKE